MSASIAGFVEAAEFDGLSVELVRHADGAIVSAVGDEDGSGAVSEQMAGGEFAHLPCSNQVNALAVQVPKIFLASSTATEAIETDDDPTAVSVRTRLATAKARVSNWSSCARTAPTARAVA